MLIYDDPYWDKVQTGVTEERFYSGFWLGLPSQGRPARGSCRKPSPLLGLADFHPRLFRRTPCHPIQNRLT